MKDPSPVLTNKLTDWVGFRKNLELNVNLYVPLKTPDQLDNEVEKFVVNLQNAAWENTPEIKRKTKGLNYPKEIKLLISQKRRARSRSL